MCFCLKCVLSIAFRAFANTSSHSYIGIEQYLYQHHCRNVLFFYETLICSLCKMQPDLVLFTGTLLSSYFLYFMFYSITLWNEFLVFTIFCFPSLCIWQVIMEMRMLNLSIAFQIFSYQRRQFLAIMIAGTHINSQRSKGHAFIVKEESAKVIQFFYVTCTWLAFRKVDRVRIQLAR